jgi:hypothetical protein
MLMNKNLQLMQNNKYVKAGLVPLGINTYKGNCKADGVVSIKYKSNGSIVIIATSGWGKSVLLKRIIDYVLGLYSGRKAGLIIDTQGVDHRLLAQKNKHPFLFKGELPLAIENLKLYTPIFASKKAYPEDKIFGISLNDMMPYDFLSSDLSYNAVMEIFKIKQQSRINREIINKPRLFYEEFSKLATASTKSSESMIEYPDGSAVNYQIKQSLDRSFSWWKGFEPSDEERPKGMEYDQWNLQKRKPYFVNYDSNEHKTSFWNEYYKKNVVVANFMDSKEEKEGMAIYGGYLLRDAYDYCNIQKEKNKDFKGMFICVEESNLFIDAENMKRGSNFYFTEILCRGFKFEIFIVANFQSIADINKEIKEHLTSGSNPVIVGNLNRRDRRYLAEIFPAINHLELSDKPENMRWGGKEWAIFYNEYLYDTFVPYPSLSEFHRRGK